MTDHGPHHDDLTAIRDILVRSSGLLEVCFDAFPTGLIVALRNDSLLKYFNKKALDFLEISKEYIRSTPLDAILDNLGGLSRKGDALTKENYPVWSNLYGRFDDSLIFHKKTNHTFATFFMKSSSVDISESIRCVIATIDDISETKTLHEKLRSATLRLENLWKASRQESITIKEVCDITLEAIVGITKSKFGFYGFIGNHEKDMIIHAWSGETMRHCSIVNKPLVYSIDHAGVWAEAIRQRKPLIINDFDACTLFKKGYPPGHVPLKKLMVIPQFVGKHIYAAAAVANKDFDYTDADVAMVTNFLNDIYSVTKRLEVEKQLKLSQEKYKALATIDPLTGLYNRRYFFDSLSKEVARTERSGTHLSVILFDLDHFKRVNDTYGHSVGDMLLKATTAGLSDSLRTIDTACRFGGEEFIIALPETTLQEAMQIAERIRERIEQTPVVHEGTAIGITASFGVSGYQGRQSKTGVQNRQIDLLVNQADEALYEAKKTGRNRVCAVPRTVPPDTQAP